ncbi:MAG TPA: von Willebrand factor type A domain-containing protein, partial [Chitinophaga sp.]
MWITGAVEDSVDHHPLPGIMVSAVQDTAGVTTNTFGLFRISVPVSTRQLRFAGAGYMTRIINILPEGRLLVALQPRPKTLDAVSIAKINARMTHTLNPNYGNVAMGVRTFYSETYGALYENKFLHTAANPQSWFAVDVDRAAYSNVRRFIRLREPIPSDAVRIEEMVNYFHYHYPLPPQDSTLAVFSAYATCPWAPSHNLLQVVVRARKVNCDSLPPSNLVFLIDVSGSMGAANKLQLLQAAFRILVMNLRPVDKVAIVAYAGAPGLILPSTSGDQKQKILNAIDNLSAGGATAGEAAIKMAYQQAVLNYIMDGNNRVILATDGDFNVGLTSDQEMQTLITEKKESGVWLTCLGFGMKDYKDSKLQTLSSKGNGNFAYIDNLEEATKIFAHEFGGTLFSVARDVKAQVSFNPALVAAYRLIGYENKVLTNDTSTQPAFSGGIVGTDHCAVATYEIVPAAPQSAQDSLAARIDLSYRLPTDTAIRTLQGVLKPPCTAFAAAPADFRFASAVSLFGMLLRRSAFAGQGTI